MQFQLTSSVLLAGAALISASPLALKRAGAPIAKPIPDTCSVYSSGSDQGCEYNCAGPGDQHFKPTDNIVASALLYQYQLEMTDYAVTSKTTDEQFEQCLETCYGYGYPGNCSSIFNAYNVPRGSTETYLCQLFSSYVSENDFNAVDDDTTYDTSRYGNIYCPAQ